MLKKVIDNSLNQKLKLQYDITQKLLLLAITYSFPPF